MLNILIDHFHNGPFQGQWRQEMKINRIRLKSGHLAGGGAAELRTTENNIS